MPNCRAVCILYSMQEFPLSSTGCMYSQCVFVCDSKLMALSLLCLWQCSGSNFLYQSVVFILTGLEP